MALKSIYVPTSDEKFWAEAKRLADTRGKSLSKLISGLIRDYAEKNRSSRDLGLPVGFNVTASMKDPRILRAETLADAVREQVLETLLHDIRQESAS